MSSKAFRSFKTTPTLVRSSFSEEQVLTVARQLLEEHAASREAATKQLNAVCGNCQGSGTVASTIAAGHSTQCWACEGTGKPNDQAPTIIPEFTDEDNLRIWKIGQLLKGKHRLAVVALVREYFPDMYAGREVAGVAN